MNDESLDDLMKFTNPKRPSGPARILQTGRTRPDSRMILPGFLFALAACALFGVLYLMFPSGDSRRPAHGPARTPFHFAGSDDFRAKIRVSGIVDKAVVIEHADSKKQQFHFLGEVVEGYKIARVEKDGVEFVHEKNPDDKFIVRLSGSQTPSEDASSFTLEGTVYGSDGKIGPDAHVWFYFTPRKDVHYVTPEMATVKSDASGKYKIEASGEIASIKAYAPPGSTGWMEKTGPWNKSGVVDLDFSTLPHFTITGTVTDEGGRPVAGAVVRSEGGWITRAVTDANGRYQLLLANRVEQLIAIALCEDGKLTAWANRPNLDEDLASGQVTPSQEEKTGPWEKAGEVNFTLKIEKPDFFIIQGVCMDTHDKPVSRVSVRGLAKPDDKSGPFTMTGVDGRYRLRVPLETTVTVLEATILTDWTVRRTGEWNQSSVVDFANIDVASRGGFYIQGTVKDENGKPVFQSSVYAVQNGTRHVAHTDTNGAYRFLVVGTVDEVTASGSRSFSQMFSKKGPFASDAVVDFDLSTATILRGTVFDLSGKPSANLRVMAYDAKHRWDSSKTNAEGKFIIRMSENQEITRLEISDHSAGIYLRKTGNWKGDSTLEIRMQSETFFSVQGVVTLDDGKPVAGVYVIATASVSAGIGAGSVGARTNDKGHYCLRTNTPLHSIRATMSDPQNRVQQADREGPWDRDTTVDLKLAPQNPPPPSENPEDDEDDTDEEEEDDADE